MPGPAGTCPTLYVMMASKIIAIFPFSPVTERATGATSSSSQTHQRPNRNTPLRALILMCFRIFFKPTIMKISSETTPSSRQHRADCRFSWVRPISLLGRSCLVGLITPRALLALFYLSWLRNSKTRICSGLLAPPGASCCPT